MSVCACDALLLLLNACVLTEGFALQADDMCSLPAMGYDFDPPHLHTVVMTDLVCPLVCAPSSLYDLGACMIQQ